MNALFALVIPYSKAKFCYFPLGIPGIRFPFLAQDQCNFRIPPGLLIKVMSRTGLGRTGQKLMLMVTAELIMVLGALQNFINVPRLHASHYKKPDLKCAQSDTRMKTNNQILTNGRIQMKRSSGLMIYVADRGRMMTIYFFRTSGNQFRVLTPTMYRSKMGIGYLGN